MYEDFVRHRISQLRISKGVSEYKMSLRPRSQQRLYL